MIRRRTFKKRRSASEVFENIFKVLILAGLIVWFLWQNNNLVLTNKFVYESNTVPKPFVGSVVAHVTDLSNSSLSIARKVDKMNPFFIVVSGNIADEDGNYRHSIKTIEKLCDIAPTFYVLGSNDRDIEDKLKSEIKDAMFIEDSILEIDPPSFKDVNSFISELYGKDLVKEADSGNELSAVYVEYVKSKFDADRNKKIELSGIKDLEDKELLSRAYKISENNSGNLMISVMHDSRNFKTVRKANIDLVLSGNTYGIKDSQTGYKKGVYSSDSSIMMISSGLGNKAGMRYRWFNNPEVQQITLSDGSLSNMNLLEKVLSKIMGEVGTRFDGDAGFTEKTYHYENGKEK